MTAIYLPNVFNRKKLERAVTFFKYIANVVPLIFASNNLI